MTEKRFEVITDYEGELGVTENRSGDVLVLKHRDLNAEQFVAQIVMFLNEQNDCIVKLVENAEEFEKKAIERITELETRNSNQARQLDDLYKLIEQKDWRALTDILDDLQKAEEQLQRENGVHIKELSE